MIEKLYGVGAAWSLYALVDALVIVGAIALARRASNRRIRACVDWSAPENRERLERAKVRMIERAREDRRYADELTHIARERMKG